MFRRCFTVAAVVCVAVALFVVVVLFPGAHSVDTLQQLKEAVSGHYRAGHPPLLAALLGAAHHATGSPGPVLVAQMLAFTAAWLTLLWRSQSAVVVVVGAVVFCLPVTWNVAATLWKDIHVATAVVVASAALIGNVGDRSARVVVVVVVVAGVVACAFRYNAVVVFVPVVIAAVVVIDRAAVRAAVVAGAVAAMLLVAPLSNRLVDAEPVWGLGPTQLWDICHFYAADRAAHRGSPWKVPRATWKRHCNDTSVKRVTNSRRGIRDLFPRGATFTSERPTIEREWRRLVRRDPRGWLRFRGRIFWRLLAVDDDVYEPWAGPWKTDGAFAPTDTSTRGYALLDAARTATSTTLQRPWPWVLALALLSAVALRRRDIEAAAVAAGLWLHLLALLVVMPSVGFRYVHVVVVGVVCVFALLVSGGLLRGLRGLRGRRGSV